MRARLSVVAILAACAGHKPAATTPKRGIEAAALPFHVLDRTGHQIDEKTFWDQLAAARAVCVGEEHPNPHHHWVQLQVVRTLAPRWHAFALGMEMVQRPFQGALDDFAASRIDDDAMRSRTGWADRWGYDYNLYGPTIHAALAAHASLLALNAAKELTKKVVHHGLDSLTADEKTQVPQLNLDDKAHRAWFDALMEDMGGSEAHSHKPEATDKQPTPEHTGSDAEPGNAVGRPHLHGAGHLGRDDGRHCGHAGSVAPRRPRDHPRGQRPLPRLGDRQPHQAPRHPRGRLDPLGDRRRGG